MTESWKEDDKKDTPQAAEANIGQGLGTINTSTGGRIHMAFGTTRTEIQSWLNRHRNILVNQLEDTQRSRFYGSSESDAADTEQLELMKQVRVVIFLLEQEKTLSALKLILQ